MLPTRLIGWFHFVAYMVRQTIIQLPLGNAPNFVLLDNLFSKALGDLIGHLLHEHLIDFHLLQAMDAILNRWEIFPCLLQFLGKILKGESRGVFGVIF